MSVVNCLCCVFRESTRSLTCNVGEVLENGRSANEEAGSNYMYEVVLMGD